MVGGSAENKGGWPLLSTRRAGGPSFLAEAWLLSSALVVVQNFTKPIELDAKRSSCCRVKSAEVMSSETPSKLALSGDTTYIAGL